MAIVKVVLQNSGLQPNSGRLFPDLGPVEFENIWYGEIAMTPTHLPGVSA